MSQKSINRFLIDHHIRIQDNPCISPDFCLHWEQLKTAIELGQVEAFAKSKIDLEGGTWSLVRSVKDHDYAFKYEGSEAPERAGLKGSFAWGGAVYIPASYENLVQFKNLVQESDSGSTVFPSAEGKLGKSSLGVGARFTSLHWPGVFWAMKHLGMGFTANQNSIPRELVYNVDKMLEGELETVPFPFIGTEVPEGHQGQSVQGMSLGCVIENLKTGFHQNRIAWSFNADHQPIGGKFDSREDDLVEGCLFATYITFDLSPELAITEVPKAAGDRSAYVAQAIGAGVVGQIIERLHEAGLTIDQAKLDELLCYVWPAIQKMKVRDAKYRQARENAFTTEKGRTYLRELSIDELPGLTTPETTAIMLALCELMEMPVHFIAPAFGFQKNAPYPDNDELESLILRQWEVCKAFGVSIGFHSGSGKSAENYQVMGRVTQQHLEIKTSGRYTYEMGRALAKSSSPQDQLLWNDWFAFTVEMAVAGAFSEESTERSMARSFVEAAYQTLGKALPDRIFDQPDSCRAALESLSPDPDLMFWFEYNFLYVLAAGGRADKSALGDHSPAGYEQRRRFYSIAEEGRLNYCKNVAAYLIFLARNTGLVPTERCDQSMATLEAISSYAAFLESI